MKHCIPTGNETVALSSLDRETGGVEALTFLYMAQKGQIELRGGERPLLAPVFAAAAGDGFAPLAPDAPRWERASDWIPCMHAAYGPLEAECTFLAPVGERGFAVRLCVRAQRGGVFRWGLAGQWAGAWHCVNESKRLAGAMRCFESGWNESLVFEFSTGGPLFAFAPMTDAPCACACTQDADGVHYSLLREDCFAAGETKTLTFFWGFGFEEVAAATSAKEMRRRGWDWEWAGTVRWLDARRLVLATPALSALYNTNLFFCMFFSAGRTLDTEELVCVTSRSPRYYVSAAYWDRDTLLWSFPAILDADAALAKELLTYVFTRQQRNFGVHSRYIDGTMLEPGFELDELAAPLLALEGYAARTGDAEFLAQPFVLAGVRRILAGFDAAYSAQLGLYETFLQPTDDEIVHPYLTYDNVLVWRALRAAAALYPGKFPAAPAQAARLKEAIYARCVRQTEAGKPYFAWSVDAHGAHDVYDEPPGSLQLLPYYGFCTSGDETWRNTVALIRSPDYRYSFAGAPVAEIGCPHAPHPWVLSLCNSLLCGYAKQAWRELEQLPMDDGIACESVDENTGVCTTGAAFATCAGFLCHSIKTAAEEERTCAAT